MLTKTCRRRNEVAIPDVLSSLEVAFLENSPPDRAVAFSRWAVESIRSARLFALNHGLALKRAGNI